MAFAKRLCSGNISRSLLRAGNSNGNNARTISSALAEAYYNDEQKEMQAAAKKLIDAEINPVRFKNRNKITLTIYWKVRNVIQSDYHFHFKYDKSNRIVVSQFPNLFCVIIFLFTIQTCNR